jgi:hypothetical protein
VNIGENGTIQTLEVKAAGEWEEVKFRSGVLAGPAWAGVQMHRLPGGKSHFTGIADGVRHSLLYRVENDRLAIIASLRNEGPATYAPKAARLVIGIDCEMRSFPSWNDRYFPTLLRCEKSHFWGYLMSPKGRIMTIGSPDPVASYNINYDETLWGSGDGGHLIRTCSLDLLHCLPLPPRHPQYLASISPGEERIWKIYLKPAASLEDIKPILAVPLSVPMIDADRYTLSEGETSRLTIFTSSPGKLTVTTPNANSAPVALHSAARSEYSGVFTPGGGIGLYQQTFTSENGHQSQACIYVRRPWSWYLREGREDTLLNKQYASSHLEQWLGLETDALAPS